MMSEWIEAAKTQPEEGQWIITVNWYGMIACYCFRGVAAKTKFYNGFTTHWMPVPPMPDFSNTTPL